MGAIILAKKMHMCDTSTLVGLARGFKCFRWFYGKVMVVRGLVLKVF